MSNRLDSTTNHLDGEFALILPTVKIFAPTTLSDEEGDLLYERLSSHVDSALERFKRTLEAEFADIRVGYEV